MEKTYKILKKSQKNEKIWEKFLWNSEEYFLKVLDDK